MAYNAEYTGEKYKDIAKAMGVDGVDSMTQEEYRNAAVEAVRKLAEDVGIPTTLKGIVKEEDIDALAADAYADACRPGNPRETTEEDIKVLFRSLM
jgi:lactaldehyde reductase